MKLSRFQILPDMSSDAGTWQVIPPKGRRGRQRLADLLTQEAVNAQTRAGTPPATSFLDAASIAADHEKLCSKWRDSSSYRELCALVSANTVGHATIKTAICLGPGSFDVRDESSRYCRSSHDAHVQLEAFRTVVGLLGE